MKLSLSKLSFSRWTKISLIVVGVLLVGWVGVMLSGVLDPPKSTRLQQTDPNRCPHCNHPLTAYAKQQGVCLFCKGDLPGKETPGRGGGAISGVLIGLFVVLLLTNVILFVRSRMRMKKEDEDYYHTYCKKCGRKVRFREQQCGQIAKCPTCRQLMRFPEAPDKRPGVWGRMKGWLTVKGRKKVNQTAD
jgi:uncharacterized paraquat-inducible protein A